MGATEARPYFQVRHSLLRVVSFRTSGDMAVQHWSRLLSTWEWTKLIATGMAISVAMTAVGVAVVWLIAK